MLNRLISGTKQYSTITTTTTKYTLFSTIPLACLYSHKRNWYKNSQYNNTAIKFKTIFFGFFFSIFPRWNKEFLYFRTKDVYIFFSLIKSNGDCLLLNFFFCVSSNVGLIIYFIRFFLTLRITRILFLEIKISATFKINSILRPQIIEYVVSVVQVICARANCRLLNEAFTRQNIKIWRIQKRW